MKRHCPQLLSVLTILSLLLCLLVAVLFARSMAVADQWWRMHGWNRDATTSRASLTDTMFGSAGGRLELETLHTESGDQQWIAEQEAAAKSGAMNRWTYHRRTLYEAGRDRQRWYKPSYVTRTLSVFPWTSVESVKHLQIPCWPIVLLLAVLPTERFIRRRRRRGRRRLGLCPACSYDLTGNVSGVCPECGTPLAHPKHA